MNISRGGNLIPTVLTSATGIKMRSSGQAEKLNVIKTVVL